MKSFQHRNYSTEVFRPKPELLEESQNNLVIVATPWGPRSSGEKAIKAVQDYYFSARGDLDSTSPFEFLDCLSPQANDLRVSVMLANDKIFQSENREEYNGGTELLVIAQNQTELTWIQIGHPMMFLIRPGQSISPIGVNLDISQDVSSKTEIQSPLPSSLLGVFETSNFGVHSISPMEGDKILMLSRSSLPSSVYQMDSADINIDEVVQLLCEDSPNFPFWAGIIDF